MRRSCRGSFTRSCCCCAGCPTSATCSRGRAFCRRRRCSPRWRATARRLAGSACGARRSRVASTASRRSASSPPPPSITRRSPSPTTRCASTRRCCARLTRAPTRARCACSRTTAWRPPARGRPSWRCTPSAR